MAEAEAGADTDTDTEPGARPNPKPDPNPNPNPNPNRRIDKADQEALESLLEQNRREHARLANAAGAGGDP